MKKIIMGLFAFSLLLLSCSKKENSVTGSVTPTPVNKHATKPTHSVLRPTGPNSTMTMSGPSKGWCNGYPWNCYVLEEVIITASAKEILDHAANSDAASNTASAFSNTDEGIQGIINGIPASFESAVLSGNYYISKQNESETKVSYIFSRDYPVTDENMEFAIEGEYETE